MYETAVKNGFQDQCLLHELFDISYASASTSISTFSCYSSVIPLNSNYFLKNIFTYF
jgi:hypothetical protein